MFAAAFGVLGGSGVGLVRAYTSFQIVRGASRRISALWDAAEEEHTLGAPLPDVMGPIIFDRVSFEYEPDQGGVYTVSLRIEPGEVVAIVGPNGAGKSTLARLLLRFYEPQNGQLLLGEREAESFDLLAWRRQFAVVTRDPAIFSLSIADNIRLARIDADPEEIRKAALSVRLHEFIEHLPGGYAAVVGEAGISLSSGQRQRLALARVFLQDASVIVLDEGMVSLDHDMEQVFTEAIHHWAGHKTVILITHQIDSSWPLTRVVRMERGRVVGNELVQAK